MSEQNTAQIRFNDGAAYERYMGVWSQSVGGQFLDWLAPAEGLRWLDVGCGNGAFTGLLLSRCGPTQVTGIDPSEEQLAYARQRPWGDQVQWHRGDAQELPFADQVFDAAVMPLVIFFLTQPLLGVREMMRTVVPGGLVSAYAWDMPGGGFPYENLLDEVRQLGIVVPSTPSADISRREALHGLWQEAGLTDVESCELVVSRRFDSFEDYWQTIQGAPSTGHWLSSQPTSVRQQFRDRLRAGLQEDADGHIVRYARANAVKGRVPRQ